MIESYTMVAVVWLLGGAIVLVGAARSFQQGWQHQGLFRLALAFIALGLAGGNMAADGHDNAIFEFARNPDMRMVRAVIFAGLGYYSVKESWKRNYSAEAKRGNGVHNDAAH